MSDFILDYRTYSGGRSVRLSPTDLRQGGLLEGKKLVDVPVVLKTPAEAEVCFSIQTNSKSFSFFFFFTEFLPSTQFNRFIKPLLIHGLLHQLSLCVTTTKKKNP